MAMHITRQDIQQMSLEEKTDLLDMIWETIAPEERDVESVEEINMLKEVLAEYHQNPSVAINGEMALQNLRSRKDDF
jgi:hypothetical protein